MRLLRLAWPLAAAIGASAVAQYPGSTPPPSQFATGFESITVADAKRYLGYLAGPECMGRGTGQPGYQKAADYVAAHFRSFGLKPAGDNGTYFQHMPFWRSAFVEKGSEFRTVGKSFDLKAGEDWTMSGITQPLNVTGSVVTLTAEGDTLNVNAADLARRIVVVKGDRVSFGFRNRLTQARPAVILYVRDVLPPNEPQVRRSAPGAEQQGPQRAATGYITTKALAALETAAGFQERTSGSGKIKMSGNMVRLSAKAEAGEIKVPNVVGYIEGSDPVLKNEVVGIGSHLDHEGVRGGQVYWGADDDGSGSTALIQVAKAFSLNPVKPKRSIIFMAFAAEEMGLVGSAFYAANPFFPNDKMIAELQMDMIGRNSVGAQNGDRNRIDVEAENIDTIRLVGSQRISTELHQTILDLNKHLNFRFKYDAEDVYTRSDHYNFAKNGIPVAFLFSGFHPDYHQPTDTIEKINFDKLTNAAKLFYLTAATLADRPNAPKKDVKQ